MTATRRWMRRAPTAVVQLGTTAVFCLAIRIILADASHAYWAAGLLLVAGVCAFRLAQEHWFARRQGWGTDQWESFLFDVEREIELLATSGASARDRDEHDELGRSRTRLTREAGQFAPTTEASTSKPSTRETDAGRRTSRPSFSRARAATALPAKHRAILVLVILAVLLGGGALAQMIAHHASSAHDAGIDASPVSALPPGPVKPVPPNVRGLITGERVTASLASELYSAGIRVLVRYVPLTPTDQARPLTTEEVHAILQEKLGLMVAQVPHAFGWTPSAGLGEGDAIKAITSARALGLPPPVCLWLIIQAPKGKSSDIVAYANAWAKGVSQAGYEPGINVGQDTPLTTADLGAIHAVHYWQGSSKTAPAPGGYQITQESYRGSYSRAHGFQTAEESGSVAAARDAGVATERIDVDPFFVHPGASPVLALWSTESVAGEDAVGALGDSPMRGLDMTTETQGVDIDWNDSSHRGVKFVIHLCGRGNEREDRGVQENVRAARAAGLVVGLNNAGYPLPSDAKRPGRDAADQARKHFDACHPLALPDDLPPILTVSWPSPSKWSDYGCTDDQVRSWILSYLETMQELWGRVPILHISPDYADAMDSAADGRLARYPLWIDNYVEYGGRLPPRGAMPRIPLPWTSWAIWQFGSQSAPDSFHLAPKVVPVASDVINAGDPEVAALLGVSVRGPSVHRDQ